MNTVQTVRASQIIRGVFDEAYQDIQAKQQFSREELDVWLKFRLEYLKECYRPPLKSPSYAQSVTRLAYIYAYESSNAEIMRYVLGTTEELHQALSESEVDIACFGGGPGSELLGFATYLAQNKKKPRINATIFDGEGGWQQLLSLLTKQVGKQLSIDIRGQSLLLDITQNVNPISIQKASFFTFSYFLTEVLPSHPSIKTWLSAITESAKIGSYFIVVDNGIEQEGARIQTLFSQQRGFRLLQSGRIKHKVGYPGGWTDFRDLIDRINHCPKWTSRMMYQVWQKKEEASLNTNEEMFV